MNILSAQNNIMASGVENVRLRNIRSQIKGQTTEYGMQWHCNVTLCKTQG